MLNDNTEKTSQGFTKNKLLELNSALSQYLPPPSLPNYHKRFPKIRIEENSPIQTTNTITNTSLKIMKWDICKESALKNNHMILCEVCLVPVHWEWYRKDLFSLDIKKFEAVQGWTAKPLGNKKPNTTIVTRGWKCQRWEYLIDHKKNENSISCEFCKSNIGCIVNSKLEGKSIWVHIQWIFWYPYTAFVSLDDKEEIESDENKFKLDSSAIHSKCIFWKVDNLITLTCDIKGWDNAFCIRWASNKNIITDIEDMRSQRHPNDEECCLIFWKEHIIKGRNAIKEGDNSVFKEGSISFEDNNSQTDKENQQPLDLVINKSNTKEWDSNEKCEFKQPDKIYNKIKKGKSFFSKRPYNKKPILASKDKQGKSKNDENSKNSEENSQKSEWKTSSDNDKKAQIAEEGKQQYKVKTRNQLRAESKDKTQLENSIVKSDLNNTIDNQDPNLPHHNQNNEESSADCKNNQFEVQKACDADIELYNRIRRISDRQTTESTLDTNSISEKIDCLLSNVKSISEKVEMQRQFWVVLHALFDKLNQDLCSFTSKEYLAKSDILELKEWMIERMFNESDNKNILQIKKREIKEIEKELEKEHNQSPMNSTQFTGFQSSQQLGLSHYLYQSAKGLVDQWKLLEQVNMEPEKIRYWVTPKLWQILSWPYNSSNKMNEYPSKFISDELVKYFSKQGFVNNSLIDISKDSEFKILGYKGLIQTNQIIEVMRDMGLIEKATD